MGMARLLRPQPVFALAEPAESTAFSKQILEASSGTDPNKTDSKLFEIVTNLTISLSI